MKIESHHTYGFEKQEVEVITSKNIKVIIDRDGSKVLTLWAVYTTYKNDQFYEQEVVFMKSNVIEAGAEVRRVFLTDEERQEIEEYIISEVETLYL